MKSNKPKYNLFKNTKYAFEGLVTVIKTENSFRLELVLSIFIIFTIMMVDVSIESKLILIITGVLVLIVELLNSSIENVVDLITNEYHQLAKNAKDIAATAVMISIVLHIVCWIVVLL